MKRLISKTIHSRRRFLSGLIGAGLAINLPLISSCDYSGDEGILTQRQKEIAIFTLNFLWPDDDFGPNIKKIRVFEYMIWMLNDKNIDPEENQYIINGLNWVNETAMEIYNQHFEKLKNRNKFKLIHKVSNMEWGESWLSKMLSIIIEAMFADPVYGSNPEGIVWQWFNHNPGQPRPADNNKYPIILNRKKENIIFTSLDQL